MKFQGFPIEDFHIEQDLDEECRNIVTVTHIPTGIIKKSVCQPDGDPLMAESITFLRLIEQLHSICTVCSEEPVSKRLH